jgi:hypothetical protein
MFRTAYITLLLLTAIVTGVSMLPNVALAATLGTFGLALILMMGAITLFIYLLALAPAVLVGGRRAAILSALLVAPVALGTHQAALGLVMQAETRIRSGDVAPEAPRSASSGSSQPRAT